MILFWTLFGTTGLAFLGWRFWLPLRNPERQPPPGDGFLSPADGYVVYVRRVERGQIPIAIKQRREIPLEELAACPSLQGASGWLMGVYMTAFSVHHNRVPLSGEVLEIQRVNAGKNRTMARLSTRLLSGRQPYAEDCDYLIENDRVTMVVATGGSYYALTQIADKWISYIINTCVPGQWLERGAQYGLIRFGSQVDVFLPDGLGYRPVAREGTYVYAGETILAEKTQYEP
ncbi:MAG TPA: phosphatidylserine decarboxylase [Saprospirales bacterium]|nr:phosphatidylserine decarboxylase [Saprospirales bacterium]